MTTLNDAGYHYTDNIDDVMAAYVNELLASLVKGRMTNVQTITTTLELDDGALPIQSITPSGADRTVELAPEATTNHLQIIHHAGSGYSIPVKDDSGTETFITLQPGQIGMFIPINGTAWKMIGAEASGQNNLINGGFSLAQRQAPGTLTTITDNKYSADRWRVTRANADVQYQRNDALGETGLTCQYYGLFKKITNTGKMHICQIVEGMNSVPARGKSVTFQIKMKASAAKTIRMAVLELQNAGTIDTIPGTLVTSWGSDSTDPTLGANVAIITGAQSKSVTTSWQLFSVTVTVPSNSKNLIAAVWSDSGFAANDTLSLAEAMLTFGKTTVNWTPRPVGQELALAQRYYWKTFALDTAPAQNIGTNTGEFHAPAPVAGANAERMAKLIYPVMMFASPTVTTYSPAAATVEFYDATASAACTSTSQINPSPMGVQLQCVGAAGTVVGNSLRAHVTAEAEL
jgi:hypothetical protein